MTSYLCVSGFCGSSVNKIHPLKDSIFTETMTNTQHSLLHAMLTLQKLLLGLLRFIRKKLALQGIFR